MLALVQASSADWYQTADVIAEAGSAVSLLAGDMPVMSDERRRRAGDLLSRVSAADGADKAELIERVTSQGARLITICQEWAARYATRPGVTFVSDPDDILVELARIVTIPQQLAFTFS